MILSFGKDTSAKLLKILICVLYICMPSVLYPLGDGSALCLLCILLFGTAAMRLYAEGKFYISPIHSVLCTLLIHSVLIFPFAKSSVGNLRYVCALLLLTVAMSLFIDYCKENDSRGFNWRILLFTTLAAGMLALADVIYWYIKVMPYTSRARVAFGLGSGDLCAAFFVCGGLAAIELKSIVGKKTKRFLYGSIVLSLTAFFLCAGIKAYIFTALMTAAILVYKKKKKYFGIIGCAAVCALCIALPITGATPLGKELPRFILRYPLGMGGGDTEMLVPLMQTHFFSNECGAGIIEKAVLCSGSVGIAAILTVFVRMTFLFIKNKSLASFASAMLTVYIVLCGGGSSFSAYVLLCAVIAYGDVCANAVKPVKLKAKALKRLVTAFGALAIIAAFLFCEGLMCKRADSLYKQEKYDEAYSLYKSCATINPLDTNARMGVLNAYCKSQNTDNEAFARETVNTLVKLEKNNASVYAICAKFYATTNEYDREVQMWREAINTASCDDGYRLSAVKALYKKMKAEKRGSEAVLTAYEEINRISEKTTDIDIKKKINDIADKAQKLTKEVITIGTEADV